MPRAALIRAGGVAAILGGVLRVAASFAPQLGSEVEAQVLYLVVDILLLLGVLGFYELRHEDVGRTGAIGFLLAIVGLTVVRSSRSIPGTDLYPVGALVFVAGLLALCVSSWKAKKLALWVPGALLFSIISGLVSTLVDGAGWLFILSGVAFGGAIATLGLEVWSEARRL